MPRAFSQEEQTLIHSLYLYFEREKANGGPLLPLSAVQERVANALEISINSVSRIVIKSKTRLLSGPKQRVRNKPVTNIDDFNKEEIRSVIHEMIEKSKNSEINVNVKNILKILKERNIFHGSASSLKKIMYNMGFKWKKEPLPTFQWSKEKLITYCSEKNLPYNNTMSKNQLWDLIQTNKPKRTLEVDPEEMYGHTVLYFLPYHSHFNPIDNIWSKAKTYWEGWL